RALRIEHDEYRLGVAGPAGADFLVGRVLRVAAGIAGRGRVDARRAPEQALGTPEAPETEDGLLEAIRERGRNRRAQHLVLRGYGHRVVAAGQRVLGRDHGRRLREEEHAVQSAESPRRYAAGAQTKNWRDPLPTGLAPTCSDPSTHHCPIPSNWTRSPSHGGSGSSFSSTVQRPSGKTSLKQ